MDEKEMWWGEEEFSEGEDLEAALAEERADILERELEQSEHPPEEEPDIGEDDTDPDAPISLDTLRQQTEETAVERMGRVAKTEADFMIVVAEMDRQDSNRERRQRYHEILRGDVPLEYQRARDGRVFPECMNNPGRQQVTRGSFLDVIYDCPYEMHNLTADPFISDSVKELKEDHKEILYFLSLRLHGTAWVAEMRGQSDRNIRKLRNTYTKKLQRKIYGYLKEKPVHSLREKEFMTLYAESLERDGVKAAKVRGENKTPPRNGAA